MNTTSFPPRSDALLPVILCDVPDPDSNHPIALLSPFKLRTGLERAMSANPLKFDEWRAAPPQRSSRRRCIPHVEVFEERARRVDPYDCARRGTPFGEAIAAEACCRDSEHLAPEAFYFPEFGEGIVVVMPVMRSPGGWKQRRLRRHLAWVHRELAAAFEAAGQREREG